MNRWTKSIEKFEGKIPGAGINIRKHKRAPLSSNSPLIRKEPNLSELGVIGNRESESRWATDTLAQLDDTDGKSSGGERATGRSDLLRMSTIPKNMDYNLSKDRWV